MRANLKGISAVAATLSVILFFLLMISVSEAASPVAIPMAVESKGGKIVPEKGTVHLYKAVTKKRMEGRDNVPAGKLVWLCKGSTCTLRGTLPSPLVSACKALAREVGEISTFSLDGKKLDSNQLRACNSVVTAEKKVTSPMPSTIGKSAEPVVPLHSRRPETLAPGSTGKKIPLPSAGGSLPSPGVSGLRETPGLGTVGSSDSAKTPGLGTIGSPAIGSGAGGFVPPTPSGPGAGLPGPRGGSSGSGSMPSSEMTPDRNSIEELREAAARCREADRPVVSFAADPAAGHAYPGDSISLRWSVRGADGGAWPTNVYLRTTRTHAPGDPRGEVVPPVGSETIASSEIIDDGATFYLDTMCADTTSARVELVPRPFITDVSQVLCERTLTADITVSGERSCGDIRITGRDFGPGTLPYRQVLLSGTDGGTAAFETVSWSDTEIVLHPTLTLEAGDYSVAVSKGETSFRQRTGYYSGVLQVRWQDRVDMIMFTSMLRGKFVNASMTLDNLTERSCDLLWAPITGYSSSRGLVAPRGLPTDDASATGPRPLARAQWAELRAYCSTSRDSEYCHEVRGCSVFQENGSFFRLNSTDEPWPIPLPIQNIRIPVYGTGYYFIDDIRSSSVNVNMDMRGNMRFAVDFESGGTEFRGFDRPDGDGDWMWPDGDMNNMRLVVQLEPRLDGGRLTYQAVSTEFSARIQAGGICAGSLDVCDELGDYKSTIRSRIETEVPASFNSAPTQDQLKDSIDDELSRLGITSISGFSFENSGGLNWLIIRQ